MKSTGSATESSTKRSLLKGLGVTILLAVAAVGCDERVGDKVQASSASSITPYQILRQEDYRRITGCEVFSDYARSLRPVLNNLVFSTDHVPDDELIVFGDAHYARRHSRDLFQALTDSPARAERCLHPTLARLAVELFVLPDDGAHRGDIPGLSITSGDSAAYLLNPGDLGEVPVFELMSRSDYNTSTECLVSPATYHKLHKAFFGYVLGTGSDSEQQEARVSMVAFLEDLGDGRPTERGTVDPICMPPAVRVLADEMGVLDGQGEYLIQHSKRANAVSEAILREIGSRFAPPVAGEPFPHVAGDLNGDGSTDVAFLGIPEGSDAWQLWVRMGQSSAEARYLSLADYSLGTDVEDVRLYVERPGRFPTACDGMPEECSEAQPEAVELEFDGILLAVRGTPGFLVYWDSISARFRVHRLIV